MTTHGMAINEADSLLVGINNTGKTDNIAGKSNVSETSNFGGSCRGNAIDSA